MYYGSSTNSLTSPHGTTAYLNFMEDPNLTGTNFNSYVAGTIVDPSNAAKFVPAVLRVDVSHYVTYSDQAGKDRCFKTLWGSSIGGLDQTGSTAEWAIGNMYAQLIDKSVIYGFAEARDSSFNLVKNNFMYVVKINRQITAP